MGSQSQNRPFKFGQDNRRELIVRESETAVQAQNDSNGNPIYYGRAIVGTATSDDKWQIMFLTYDGNQGLTSITWPQNSEGNASINYEFIWDNRATYTYS